MTTGYLLEQSDLQPPGLSHINVSQPGFLSGKTPPARCVYFPVVFVASISERGMMRGEERAEVFFGLEDNGLRSLSRQQG